MNRLEEMREYIKNFICEKGQVQKQIAEIEEKRTQLSQQRNEEKKSNRDWSKINELGRKITELGNKSQELQNKLDFKCYEVKLQTKLIIDNLVLEDIRKIRKLEDEIQLLKEITKSELEISQLKKRVTQLESEITILTEFKKAVRNGNWNTIIEDENASEEICIEPLTIEAIEPIEEISIEEFAQPEELYIEEFQPIEELHIEGFKEENETQIEVQPAIKTVEEAVGEKDTIDEIEVLARKIVEEIVAEQTKDLNISPIEENENIQDIIGEQENIVNETVPEDIIAFEDDGESRNKEKIIIPLFGIKATISSITVKIEDRELVYKAQMSDGEEIKIYPAKIGEENALLRDKQNREECKEILTNYSISEYRSFDKKVVNKIDPLVCELLSECAERYDYNAPELIYNYAMSFSYKVESDIKLVPEIIYNLSYIEQSNLCRKEKSIMNKICKNAKKNDKINIIETFSGFNKIKYTLKRLFAVNNVKVLPEAKY